MKLRIALLVLLLMAFPSCNRDRAKVSMKAGSGPSVSLACNGSAGASSYNFYRSTVSGSGYSLLGSSATCAYTDATVAYGTTYYYVSSAVNDPAPKGTCPAGKTCESAYSNQATAVIPANPTPNPPTNLTVGSIQSRQVPLQWTAPDPQPGVMVNAYNVYRGSKPTLPSPAKVATVISTAFTDAAPKGVWYYEIRAKDTEGKKQVLTEPSNIVKAVVN